MSSAHPTSNTSFLPEIITSRVRTNMTKIYSARSSPASGVLKKSLQCIYWHIRTSCPSSLHQKQMSKNIRVEVWIFFFKITALYSRYLHFSHVCFWKESCKVTPLAPPNSRDEGIFQTKSTPKKKNNHKTKLALGLQDHSDGFSLPCPQLWGGQNIPALVLAPSCRRWRRHPLGMNRDDLRVFYFSQALLYERGRRG